MRANVHKHLLRVFKVAGREAKPCQGPGACVRACMCVVGLCVYGCVSLGMKRGLFSGL